MKSHPLHMNRQGPENITMAQVPESEPLPTSAKDAATMLGNGVPSAPMPPSSTQNIEALVGRVLDGRYLIEEAIGAGGMGVVYRGKHQVIGKKVAIKVLRGEMAADHEMTERFLNEARAASSIGNPHIVDISDFGRIDDGSAYFVMEYLEGRSLMDLMQNLRVIPVSRIVHIAKQIARALSAAHQRGIVHRDLKPDNVMLIQRGDDNDFVKILDFGIAKVGQATSRLTKAGSVFGTPHYMSPEQAAGTEVTQATDIYSLGVILYEMAAGKVPFDADNFMGILTQHMYKAPAYLRTLVPQPQEIPVSLDAVVHKCLAKKVEHRYQTMDELIVDMDRAQAGETPEAVHELMARSGGFNVPADYFRTTERHGGAMIPGTPFHRRKPILLTAIITACVVFAVVGIMLIVTTIKNTTADAKPAVDTPPPAPAVVKANVAVFTQPIGNAVVFDDDNNKTLGANITLELGSDEVRHLHASAPGYKNGTAECRVTNERQCIITLEKDGPVEKPATNTQPSQPTPPAWAVQNGKKPPPTPPTAKPAVSVAPTAPKKCPPGKKLVMGDCWNIDD